MYIRIPSHNDEKGHVRVAQSRPFILYADLEIVTSVESRQITNSSIDVGKNCNFLIKIYLINCFLDKNVKFVLTLGII